MTTSPSPNEAPCEVHYDGEEGADWCFTHNNFASYCDEIPPPPNVDGHTPEVRYQGYCGGCYHCGSREEWWACAKCGEEWPCATALAASI